MTTRSRIALVLALALSIGAGLASLSIFHAGAQTAPAAEGPRPLNTGTFAKLADSVKPAVINVNVQGKVGGVRNPLEELPESFRRRFGGEMPQPMPRRGVGSGVIIDPAGVALTNAHVVDGATKVDVVLHDGTKHAAKVVGMDKKTDLAVLRIGDGKGVFPFLPLGDSDAAQVGDWVIAVGSPFGLQATVTSGILSAKARQIGAGPFDDFLQTDAAINPGNSGGPLVNMRGEVIGINTAIVRGGSGIGFAIPSNMAKRISGELLAKGTVTRGWLGVSIQPLTPELATAFGVKEKGALIAEVVPDSPAAKAGLKAGDVVVEFDGKPIGAPGDLARVVGLGSPGQEAKMKIWRDRAEMIVQVKSAEAPTERRTARLGLEVQPVTPDIARELEISGSGGVVVTRVEDGSPAAKAGLRTGDVIREMDREPIKTLADFERVTKNAKNGQPLTVRVQRGSSSLYLALAPSDKG